MSKKIINELAEEIFKARNHYYNGTPIISDATYDILADKLRRLQPDHPALTDVGCPIDIASEWQKANHQIPMGSLDKVQTPEELSKWVSDIFKSGNSVFVTEKLDGISIELIYDNGKLIQAITRGDGLIGEDITSNVAKMGGVKTQLPVIFNGSLRGEIILKRSKMKKFFSDKANTRNTAAGVSKRLDGVGCEHLDILLYQVLGDTEFLSEFLQFRFLEEAGLSVPGYEAYAGKDISKFVNDKWIKYQEITRDTLDYDIDGLVVRVNDLETQLSLGDTDMRPKGARAYKFESEEAITKVVAIICQTGNSGRITPVGEVDPVILVGAQISRASLYNFAYIQSLGVDVGSEVIICRANDVIPRIKSVITSTNTVFKAPNVCPACTGPVEMVGENLMCISTDTCPAQKIGRIKNWISTLNILEWGDTLLARLVETGKVSNVADLYKLSSDDLASMERMGKKSADKCHSILWTHDTIPLELFLGGLSIPMIGSSMIKLVMKAGYDTFNKIFTATRKELEEIKGMGPAKSASMYEGLKRNKDLIYSLMQAGIKIKEKVSGSLNGMSFCFTGTMKNKRPALEQMVIDNGGESKNQVGKGLTYLVIDDINSGTGKAVAARKFGTKLISENDFLKKI